jgi:hypothetical protein
MHLAPEPVLSTYLAVIEQVILNLRMRIRNGEEPTLHEIHDILDAIHNVPKMLRNYGGWHVEENIDRFFSHYDEKWLAKPDSKLRRSYTKFLQSAQNGEFDCK